MDADLLFTESHLNRLLRELRCRHDDDCRLGDCQAQCNITQQRCSARINDNVDVCYAASYHVPPTYLTAGVLCEIGQLVIPGVEQLVVQEQSLYCCLPEPGANA